MNRSMTKLTALMAMMLLLFAFGGCSDDDDDGGTGPGTTVDEFMEVAEAGDAYFGPYAGVNTTAGNVYTVMTDGDDTNDYYIIDWRSSTDYDNAHIEGAVNMSLGALVDEIDNMPTDQTILNVCYTGQSASTATAVINLIGTETGHTAVNLKFGMSGWTSNNDFVGTTYTTNDDLASVMVTTDFPKPAAGDYPTIDTGMTDAVDILKARAEAYLVAGWKKILPNDLWTDPNYDDWFVLNYFPDTEYQAGHLPGAIQYVPKSDILTTADLNTLPTDQKIAVYCWTGQTSAQLTAYLNMLGYDAYSVLYGVQKMCHSDATINTHPYSDPNTDYPVVGTGVTK